MKDGQIAPDRVLVEIADYVADYTVTSRAAYETARYCLIDSLGCAFEALGHPECTKLLGAPVPGTVVPHGARVPGTQLQLDPATAAFNTGCLVRWLDFNDTWVAAQTTHPSDDVGAILAVADHLSRSRTASGETPLAMEAVLESMIKAHELQGVLGMENALSGYGIDHVLLLKVACAAVVTRLLGGGREEIINAVSLAFFEPSLALHRYGSNTGPRKGWAAADSASQAIRFAGMAVKGEPGYPEVLTHPKWGFNQVFLKGDAFTGAREYGTLVMENVLFKLQCPVVIHAQSSIECALRLHESARNRIDDIARIKLLSHQRTLKTIDKRGPLRNAADRDHCLQYAVAVALLHGRLTAEDYEDEAAADPRIDRLRDLMTLEEDADYTQAYLDPQRRMNPNSIQVFFKDGSATPQIKVEHPIGHPARRAEGIPMLIEKFRRNLARRYPARQREAILAQCLDHDRFMNTAVHKFTDLLAI
ncbi:MAG: bifunctional 2-methylcitrate dehydratase/aconitate hydratase [Burkholderiales bacterium]|nr:bifunctional 2-methylcitrate dehydratase/aconitate hydratase [Burkholderiales bacterium]